MRRIVNDRKSVASRNRQACRLGIDLIQRLDVRVFHPNCSVRQPLYVQGEPECLLDFPENARLGFYLAFKVLGDHVLDGNVLGISYKMMMSVMG